MLVSVVVFGPPALTWAGGRSCGLEIEGGDAQQVVGGAGDEEPGPVALSTAVAEFASSSDGLDPAEGFLDAFADALAHLVPRVAGRASVDGGALPRDVRRDVGG